MAKSSRSNPNSSGPSFHAPRYRPRWFVAVFCLLLGVWLSVAYFDYSPLQRGWFTNNTTGSHSENLMGTLGTDVARVSFIWFGLAAWLLPLFSLWSLLIAVRNARRLAFTRFVGMVVALGSLCGVAAMVRLESFQSSQYFPEGRLGGAVGHYIYDTVLADAFGLFGSGSLLVTVYIVSLFFIFTKDIAAEFEKTLNSYRAWRERRALSLFEKAELKKKQRDAEARRISGSKAVLAPPPKSIKLARSTQDPFTRPPATSTTTAPMASSAPATTPEKSSATTAPLLPAGPSEKPAGSTTAPMGTRFALNIVKPEETRKARGTVPQTTDDTYRPPPLDLLRERVEPHAENSEEEHGRNADNLQRILSEFGVEVTLGEIHVGPVITRYEIAPAPGVRVEKIAGLDKNIALGMRAQSVRILAPIPGKAAVGVEVPNLHPTPVGIREILEAEDWANSKAELPIALGKDVSGKPLISDLTKMPHLLIAGATGSGKSVCINSIIASIIYRKSPKDVRLLMIDPKVVELKIFNDLPHMLIPVVTEPKKVPGALKWLIKTMDERYQMFAKCNVRNMVGFNERKKLDKPELPPVEQQGALEGVDPSTLDDSEPLPDRLPYIVAIIDELADLMMVAPAEVETSIARLAQLARAAGIHLIIATQRPSVNVITGVIKANLPSRIAFQVASQVDSRTILDTKGADTLIGRGDMLFSPPGTSRLVRAQGAFISDDEVIALVDYFKTINAKPVYAHEVQAQIDAAVQEEKDGETGGSVGEGEVDDEEELFRQALDVLRSTKRASTSMIQRRLRVGYNRAARIMDLMQDRGIVGPENGSSPREILKDLDTL